MHNYDSGPGYSVPRSTRRKRAANDDRCSVQPQRGHSTHHTEGEPLNFRQWLVTCRKISCQSLRLVASLYIKSVSLKFPRVRAEAGGRLCGWVGPVLGVNATWTGQWEWNDTKAISTLGLA